MATAVAVGVALHAQLAGAVIIDGASAPSNLLANGTASYTVTAHTEVRNERINTALFTFPDNTDLTGVSVATVSAFDITSGVAIPVKAVVTDPAARTVLVRLGYNLKIDRVDFSVTVGGVVNPSQPGDYSYSASVTTGRNTATFSTNYTLAPNPTAVTVGAVTVTPDADAVAAAYTIPVTLGPQGRLSGTTANGPNTITLSFPAEYALPAAPPASSVSLEGTTCAAVTVAGQNVTLTLPAGLTIPGGTAITIAIDMTFGLVNPVSGSYTLGVSTSAESATGSSPPYTIQLVPYLSLSVDPHALDFGSVDPGTMVGPMTVTVQVNSNLPVTITRAYSGSAAELGLTASGSDVVTLAAGFITYTDSFWVNAPYSTDPGIPLTASVQYTVSQ